MKKKRNRYDEAPYANDGRQSGNAPRPYTEKELKKMPRKERKAYRKDLYERQDALEAQLVANGAIAPRKKREGRSFLWNIIAVCLAFFLGLLAALGGLVGGGYFALTKFSAKSILGENYASLIKEDYAEKSLAEIGGEFINDLSSGLDSLGKIGKYTPIVENMLGSVTQQLETLGIQIDVNEFMNVPFSEFGAYMQNEVLLKTELGKALKVDGNSSSLIKAICYGQEGEDYTVDPETMAITPTETGRGATTIETLTSDTSFIGGLAVSDILEVGESSPEFLKAIQDWTVEELSQSGRIERLKLKQVIGMENNTSALMNAIGEWRIKDLTDQTKMDTLLLSDLLIIDEDSPMILQSLKNVTLGDFHTKIDKLRLGDILGETAIESNKLLKPLKDSSIGTLSEDLKTLTVEQVFGAEIFSYMEINGGVTYLDMYADYAAHYTEESYNAAGTDKRPQAIADPSAVKTYYTINGSDVRALKGFFTHEEGGAYTLLPENISIRKETTAGVPRYYAETEQTVVPQYKFQIVNYETNGLDELPAGASIGTDTDPETGENFYTITMTVETESGASLQTFRIYEDGLGFYYRNGKSRVDLERVAVSYFYTGADGAEVVFTVTESGTVQDKDGNPVKVYLRRGEDEYFIKTERQACLQYYVPEDGVNEYTAVYGEEDVTECYEYEKGGAIVRLDRFLTGVWFLLLTEEKADGSIEYKTDTNVLDMSSLVGTTTARVTATALWELYFHRTLETNPFVKFLVPITLSDGTAVQNLNQLTIVQTIEAVQKLSGGGA